MKVLVTGATGFIGRHVVFELLEKRHDVYAIARNIDKARQMPWYDKVNFISCDLHSSNYEFLESTGIVDSVIHLAWHGLSDYKDFFHVEENLPFAFDFIKRMVLNNIGQIMVSGTCLEYGLQNGELSEETLTAPTTPYGIAKDALRKYLQAFQMEHPFILQWVRLFYVHGPGQSPNSLLAQLDRAIDNKDEAFNMSGGEQLRDYLLVEEVARNFVFLLEHPECNGVINCCSGRPVSVRNLVEKRIMERGAKIKLNMGHYPYPDYEPMAFWGNNARLREINSEG